MMNYKLMTPCAHCPFRFDIPGFLHPDKAEDIANDVLRGSGSFPCHKTLEWIDDNTDEGLESRQTETTQMCAGAMIFAEHCEEWGQMLRIAERMRWYDPAKLALNAPIHTCIEDMINHQIKFGNRR